MKSFGLRHKSESLLTRQFVFLSFEFRFSSFIH